MICTPCALAADNKNQINLPRCPACRRHVQVYGTSPDFPGSYNKIMHHRVTNPEGGPRVKCPGSGKHALITGHDACTGCDCQHHPAGTRQQKEN